MVQKPWFKVFIWFLATFIFFLASCVIVSIFKPRPSENEVMSYMSGMMGAMENSIMGTMMRVEGDKNIRDIMILSLSTFPLMLILSIIVGLILRKRSRGGKK
jgi:predicted permease